MALAHGVSSQDAAASPSISFGDLDALAFALPTKSEQQKNQMDVLVVVGTVTATTARVLYEPLVNDESSITVSLVLQRTRHDHELVKTFTHLQHQSFPYATAFDNLVPNSIYFVHVQVGAVYTAVGRFRTPPRVIANDMLVVLSLSCDRFLDDADDSHWLHVAQEVRDPAYYGTVHTGDQIYADSLLSSFQHAQYDAILNGFRGLYRRAFGRPIAQRVLRHGAHYMQMDDHDVVNNWSRDTWITHNTFVRAGLQAFYEYQYQLHRDWTNLPPCRSAAREDLHRPVYHQVMLGANELQLVFADTRLERGLTLSTKQLVSKTQLKFLQDAWATNATQRVLFTPVPLFFHTQASAAFAAYIDDELYPGHEHFTSVVQEWWSQLPSTGLQLVAGDLHMAQQSTICDATKCVPQLIASGVTKDSTAMTDRRLLVFYYFITQWAQKAACVWSKVAAARGQRQGYCMQSESLHYGQNFAKLTWDHGIWTADIVAKPYDDLPETFIQAVLTWALDFRTVTSVVVMAVLRSAFESLRGN